MRLTMLRLLPVAIAAASVPLLAGVAAAASAPEAVDDAYYARVGHQLVVFTPGLMANDRGLAPSVGVFVLTAPPTGVVVQSEGNFAWTPSAAGSWTFQYCLAFTNTAQCLSSPATVTLRAVQPVAKDDAYQTAFATALTVAAPGVLGNDLDVPPGAEVGWLSSPSGLAGNPDGGFTFEPGRASGTTILRYCVLDDNVPPSCMTEAQVVVTVAGPPTAVDDTYEVAPGESLTIAAPGLLANDTGLPAGAVVSAQSPLPAGLTLQPDGGLRFAGAPRPGSVSFPYCVLDVDPRLGCASNVATATVVIAVKQQPSPSAASPSPSPAASSPSPSPAVSSPAPSPSGGGSGGLPVTGPGATIVAVVGLLLLALGGGVLLVTRRFG